MYLVLAVVFAFVFLLAVYRFSGSKPSDARAAIPHDSPIPGTSNDATPRRPDDDNLAGPGTFSLDVVGESRYQANLSRIAGGKKKRAANLVVIAELVLEDSNPLDEQAVRVDVEGSTVGYLDRENARVYRKLLARLGKDGRSLRCPGKVVGGWFNSKDDQGHFGVKLDLDTRLRGR